MMSNKEKKINHVGIIMDGNRRWAKKRLLPAVMGHKAGFENVENILPIAIKNNIQNLTLWALSTDNLEKRAKQEVDGIIKLINKSIKLLPKLQKNNVKFKTIGDIEKLPKESISILKQIEEATKDNDRITLTIALVYGGQDEIIRAIKKFIKEGGDIEKLDKLSFKDYLDTKELPNPDLIIRTGGDIRHSGFLLYDSEYSEYYFTEKSWPDFDEEEMNNAINTLKNSNRTFGGNKK